MKTSGLWLGLLGVAVVAGAATILNRAEAAEKDGMQKIVDLIKAGKTADAKAAAKSYATAHPEVDELMEAFKKGFLARVPVEATINKFNLNLQSATVLGKADYQDIGAIATAVGMVSEAIPAPKSPKGNKSADWIKFAKDLGDNGVKLQAAIKSKSPADVKTAANKINAACTSCHLAFKTAP